METIREDYLKIIKCIKHFGALPVNKRLISFLSGVNIDTVTQIGNETGIFTEDTNIQVKLVPVQHESGVFNDFVLMYGDVSNAEASLVVEKLNTIYKPVLEHQFKVTHTSNVKPSMIAWSELETPLSFPDLLDPVEAEEVEEVENLNDFRADAYFVSTLKEGLVDIRDLLL